MKEAADAAEFEEFANAHRAAILVEVLATKRQGIGKPNWHPSGWMQGMAVQAQVNKILRNGSSPSSIFEHLDGNISRC
jgi:hypothetical protein